LRFHKSTRKGLFFWMAFVYLVLFLFLLLGHGFDSRGLLIICTCIFALHYRLFYEFGEFYERVYKSAGTVSFFWMASIYWIIFCFYYFIMNLKLGAFYNLHVSLSFPLQNFFMSLGNPIFEDIKADIKAGIKVQELFQFSWWLWSIDFIFFRLLGHKFDISGLFITCMCFIAFQYTCFLWDGEFYFRVHKHIGTVSFIWMASIYWTIFISTILSWIWN